MSVSKSSLGDGPAGRGEDQSPMPEKSPGRKSRAHSAIRFPSAANIRQRKHIPGLDHNPEYPSGRYFPYAKPVTRLVSELLVPSGHARDTAKETTG